MRDLCFAGLVGLVLVGAGVYLLAGAPVPTSAANDAREDAFAIFSPPTPAEVFEGKASWYGPGFHGRPTSSGVLFNRYALTAAHRTLRAGTVVRVTNLRNQRSTVLIINDWGPVPEDRVLDVSEAAAEVLGFREQGLARVRVEVYRAAHSPLM
ncbi:MAG: septal ring lytic transglycosylase RlpA family protein [Acidobacteria bacterium]|nr:septal ring lytic transglycosylase RlpA family protein [Acidobacteriota bacterium]